VSKGVFVVSVDTELGWGRGTLRDLVRYIPRLKETRGAISEILKMCERHRVAFTWAIVGGLLGDNSVNPPFRQIMSPQVPYPQPHCSRNHQISLEDGYLWYGRDIVNSIRNCQMPQEIGCHSFSHISYDEQNCSVAAASSDLEHCRKMFGALGLSCQTFIFPLNKVGHLALLPRHGFICYRGPEPNTQSQPKFLPSFLRAFQLVYRVIGGPSLTRPSIVLEDLVNIPASMFFRVPEIKSLFIWRKILDLQVRIAQQGLLRAARRGLVFHLWFHPFQFGFRSQEMLAALDGVLSLAIKLRGANRIEILTMSQLARRFVRS
jgi:hypothetical protein